METQTVSVASWWEGVAPEEVLALEQVAHPDPHHVLGAHPRPDGSVIVRVYRPGASAVRCVPDDPSLAPAEMEALTPWGLWGARFSKRGQNMSLRYRVEVTDGDGGVRVERDAYSFPPTLGEMDEHLVREGQHRRLYEKLGAHARAHEGVEGVSFAVWAPDARRVSVVGDWNRWDGRVHPMRRLGSTGIWELFIPGLAPGHCYKFEVLTRQGALALKFDPYALQAQLRPETASVIAGPAAHTWGDEAWLSRRAEVDLIRQPVSIYEVHLGSWMRVPEEGGRWLTYAELAPRLADHVKALGFTHVELMPVAEHPFDGSWGYQVTGYFAPTSRHGTPDEFRALVDHLHQRGIGVILDWVPAHFPRDAFALARFDGTALYEHDDPRQGEHPDWGTLIFNYGRNEVRNFLLANALYWIDRFHLDGLRVDAVAAMLYLDYSRQHGEWVPNAHGGRENLAAISFLQDLNRVVHGEFPGAIVVAEESTAWPGVSRPTYLGGLGFTFKWNMGWMHDTLKYFSLDPIHRRYHHHQLTFGMLYAWSENFVLPLSHDEVVHLKGSLLHKMSGDRWQRFANLRALYGWMWCHPGKKLLFMGGELAQEREWNHDASLDWHLLERPEHAGVRRLVADLNALYQARPALWEADVDPEGFRWIDANDSEQSVASFLRYDRAKEQVVACVLNATPVARLGYRVGVPRGGAWREAINTDAEAYGGSNLGNGGRVQAREVPWHGQPWSLDLVLPPLSVLILEPSE